MPDLNRYPSVQDLREKAHRRMPHFSWEMLDSGTGQEHGVVRSEADMQKVEIVPRMLTGRFDPEMATTLFGQEYAAPFGMAPIGLSGLLWPKAEIFLARAAARAKIPYCLSAVGAETPETIGPEVGDCGWFQYYPTRERQVRDDILKRVRDSGFKVLVITVDVPVTSSRERQLRAGIRIPPSKSLRTFWHVARRPAWALSTLMHRIPHLVTLEPYVGGDDEFRAFLARVLHGRPDWDDMSEIRDIWNGPIVLKGIMDVADAVEAARRGFEGIVVSNHGARQTDAAPSPISVLPEIAREVGGKTAVIFDGGLRTGLDIIRAQALGADFCLLGRAFLYAVGALGETGAHHVTRILAEDWANNMIQLGVRNVDELRQLKITRPRPTNW